MLVILLWGIAISFWLGATHCLKCLLFYLFALLSKKKEDKTETEGNRKQMPVRLETRLGVFTVKCTTLQQYNQIELWKWMCVGVWELMLFTRKKNTLLRGLIHQTSPKSTQTTERWWFFNYYRIWKSWKWFRIDCVWVEFLDCSLSTEIVWLCSPVRTDGTSALRMRTGKRRPELTPTAKFKLRDRISGVRPCWHVIWNNT